MLMAADTHIIMEEVTEGHLNQTKIHMPKRGGSSFHVQKTLKRRGRLICVQVITDKEKREEEA